MGNLISTIKTYQSAISIDELNKNVLLFITSSGIYSGEMVTLQNEKIEVKKANDFYLYGYSIANGFDPTLEIDSDIDLSQTILLKDVKVKTGNLVMNLPFCVLNVSQIVSVQLVHIDTVDQLLNSY